MKKRPNCCRTVLFANAGKPEPLKALELQEKLDSFEAPELPEALEASERLKAFQAPEPLRAPKALEALSFCPKCQCFAKLPVFFRICLFYGTFCIRNTLSTDVANSCQNGPFLPTSFHVVVQICIFSPKLPSLLAEVAFFFGKMVVFFTCYLFSAHMDGITLTEMV